MWKLFFIAVAAMTIGGCHVQTVDAAQPIAAANDFYSTLKSNNVKAALTHFAPEFKNYENNWPRLLDGLQQRYGPVTAADLQTASLAANGNDPCYSLTYAVKRGTMASTEILFLCSVQGQSTWLIRGHEVTRLDTGQSIAGGVVPQEIGVHVP
jgi:hypothetical protein